LPFYFSVLIFIFIRASNGDEQTHKTFPISKGGVGLALTATPQGFYFALVSECFISIWLLRVLVLNNEKETGQQTAGRL
jgi:hypothetical protein